MKDLVANEHKEYLIIGAGPSGLQLGYYLEKANRDYLILEGGTEAGTSFQQYPRHRKLISINKVHTGYDDPEVNLRWDWNSLLSDSEEMLFKNYSRSYFPDADDFVTYLQDFAIHFNLKIKYETQVIKVLKKQDLFFVFDRDGNIYSSERLIIATGFRKPYIPSIPGIEFAENYTNVSINPEDFANQRVLIVGKGNSGFETADNLVGTTSLIHIASPHSVSMAWTTKYVGHLRAVNNNLLDTYQLKSQNALLDAHILKIEYQDDGKYVVTFHYTHAAEEIEDIVYDRVILCTGFRFDDSIFDRSCRPELAYDGKFPNLASDWESTNVKDMYFAGVLMHMRDYKKKQSGFIHGFRYNIRAMHQIFEHKYHNQELPNRPVVIHPKSLTKAVLDRINTNSDLWQQTGYLCDVIVCPEQGDIAQYYQALPVDYVHKFELGQNDHYYVITMEFGLEIIQASPDPFAVTRVHKDDFDKAALSSGIHPIIRHYYRDTLVAECHVLEDLASEWKENVHFDPLMNFFGDQLTKTQDKQIRAA